MIDSLIEGVVRRFEPQIVRDASSLATVVAYPDSPAGVVVLPIAAQDCMFGGMTIGSGHALADAYGNREGVAAIAVCVGDILRAELADCIHDPAQAIGAAVSLCEAVTCHELAHALVAPPDSQNLTAIVKGLIANLSDGREPCSPADTARTHPPQWAAADYILQRRAARLRPAARRPFWDWYLREELSLYGYDFETIAGAVGDQGHTVSVRRLLSPGSPLSLRLTSVCPDDAARAAILEQRLRKTPPV